MTKYEEFEHELPELEALGRRLMGTWIDVQMEPLPTDAAHPMFEKEWPILWVYGDNWPEAQMATWGPCHRWVTHDDGSLREFVRNHWQFSEYLPGSDDMEDKELKNVRWYQPVYKPDPPKLCG